ncbi:hypothetical protein DENIS_1007 [Desulfonema ishimotonii]|uniref:DUF4395 domain-containing protein n=2 Tax=Desulfonema ishimotonii TaxID=45657 RepID=A0A401FSX9_9BACT|nr:hypothetical protein DENIS_1007 [Desulfonema ishimotonii]
MQSGGVPMPIVVLNRWMLLVGILLGLFTLQPWITTLLFLILLAAVIGGPEWSLVARAGKKLFADKIPTAEREDFKLTRFNNTIAVTLLGLAQLCFLAGWPVPGWIFAILVAIAAGVAIGGFCVGCFLYFQLRMLRYRFLGK